MCCCVDDWSLSPSLRVECTEATNVPSQPLKFVCIHQLEKMSNLLCLGQKKDERKIQSHLMASEAYRE